jgi:citrate synthase
MHSLAPPSRLPLKTRKTPSPF